MPSYDCPTRAPRPGLPAWAGSRQRCRPSSAARLAQLSDSARATVSLAATIGRAFTLDVLIEASDDDVDSLVGALDELWQRRIVREHGTSAYDFSHDKIREVAYAEMSAARRLMLHRRVAHALERVYAANLDAVSAQVATHYEQGGLPAQAVPYFQRAAGLAQRVYANAEAIHLLNKGLALLASLPPSQERDELELALQTALGTSLVATDGYGASETLLVYKRSQELCQHLGKPRVRPSCVPWLSHPLPTQSFSRRTDWATICSASQRAIAIPCSWSRGTTCWGDAVLEGRACALAPAPRASARALRSHPFGGPSQPVHAGPAGGVPHPVGGGLVAARLSGAGGPEENGGPARCAEAVAPVQPGLRAGLGHGSRGSSP